MFSNLNHILHFFLQDQLSDIETRLTSLEIGSRKNNNKSKGITVQSKTVDEIQGTLDKFVIFISLYISCLLYI